MIDWQGMHEQHMMITRGKNYTPEQEEAARRALADELRHTASLIEAAIERRVIGRIVMLHGFEQFANGEREHCDYDRPDCDGWNVWVRRNYNVADVNGELFDSDDKYDLSFDSYEAAHAYAVKLSEKLDCDIDEY